MVRRSALGQMGTFTRSLLTRFRASDASPPRSRRRTPLSPPHAPAAPRVQSAAAPPTPASRSRPSGRLRAFPDAPKTRETIPHDQRPVRRRESSRRLADLLRREHAALADFLVALADFDRQRLWLQLGYPNLFEFLHRELGLSRGAAHYRKVAARLVQRFPEVVEPLRDGRLCMSSILALARVLTETNRVEAIPRFFHCSKQEAKAVAVEILPAAVIPRREMVTVRTAPPAARNFPVVEIRPVDGFTRSSAFIRMNAR